jgi:hypothetical protein
MSADEWDSLDDAAHANLDDKPSSLTEFFKYKEQLRSSGCTWKSDACDILTGFIWNEIEE